MEAVGEAVLVSTRPESVFTVRYVTTFERCHSEKFKHHNTIYTK